VGIQPSRIGTQAMWRAASTAATPDSFANAAAVDAPYVGTTMTDASQLERLLKAVKPVIDRHIEQKNGHSYFEVPMTGAELKELRSAYEPFRDHYKS
jgi:hypothetical protein